MNKSPDKTDDEIVNEKYQGPSITVTTLGEGAIKHLKWAMVGMVGGGLAAAILPTQAAKIITTIRNYGRTQLTEPTTFVKAIKNGWGKSILDIFGQGPENQALAALKKVAEGSGESWFHHALTNKEHGFGSWFLTHTVGLLPFVGRAVKDWMAKPTTKIGHTIITTGGFFGALGYAGGWAIAVFKGANQGNKGRLQHERIQQIALNQSDRIDDLENRLSRTKAKMLDLQTKQDAEQGKLRVAKDEQPQSDLPSASTPTPTDTAINSDNAPGKWRGNIAAQKAAITEFELA